MTEVKKPRLSIVWSKNHSFFCVLWSTVTAPASFPKCSRKCSLVVLCIRNTSWVHALVFSERSRSWAVLCCAHRGQMRHPASLVLWGRMVWGETPFMDSRTQPHPFPRSWNISSLNSWKIVLVSSFPNAFLRSSLTEANSALVASNRNLTSSVELSLTPSRSTACSFLVFVFLLSACSENLLSP